MITTTIEIPKFARIFRGRIPFYRKRKATLPTQWSELRLRHFPALEAFFAQMASIPTDDLPAISSAAAILFCRWMKIDPQYADFNAIAHNQKIIKLGLGFLTQKHSTTPLHKRILHMRGPGSQLTHLRYQQFILAEGIYERYRANPNPKDITLLITITHRCSLLPYVHKLSELRYHIFKLLPMRIKIRALFTYIAQRTHLPERYPELYKAPTGKAPSLHIDQQILNQCGTELGSYAAVAAAPLHRVLELMQLKEIQALKNNPNYAKRNATLEGLYAKAGYTKRPNWAK